MQSKQEHNQCITPKLDPKPLLPQDPQTHERQEQATQETKTSFSKPLAFSKLLRKAWRRHINEFSNYSLPIQTFLNANHTKYFKRNGSLCKQNLMAEWLCLLSTGFVTAHHTRFLHSVDKFNVITQCDYCVCCPQPLSCIFTNKMS